MQVNQPVTQRELQLPEGSIIVSTTDVQGRITHCNRAFVEMSGYSYDELLGQPHNIIRHPDMPPEAFKDLWATVGRGRPWTGVVKNRCKNGDHYWVQANVTPILRAGKPVGYISVRLRPSRQDVLAAERLYAQVAAERRSQSPTIALHAGRARKIGWRDLPSRLHRLTLSKRLGLAVAAAVALPVAVVAPSLTLSQELLAGGVGLASTLALVAWFHHRVQQRLDNATQFVNDLAACNLNTQLDLSHPNPLSHLSRCLWQVQLNLRAVVSDVGEEIAGTAASIADIAQGTQALARRTEQQTSAQSQAVHSMAQFAEAARQVAQTTADVARRSESAAATAASGGQAVDAVGETIQAIADSSRKVADIVSVIEGIAFQTNILALNAAVEAARAGDQGRGFAVVATEVRTLARRCAEASKEVRALVQRSTQSVDLGTTRMDSASLAIDNAVLAVNEMGGMVRDIAVSTNGQSVAIAEVNQAMADIGEMTQANSDLVQQSSESAIALSQRVETLKRTVRIFELG